MGSTAAVLGAGETMVFQLRASVADVPNFACTIGPVALTCDVAPSPRFTLGKDAPNAMRVTQTSNNADDDAKCVVMFGIQ
jgi:hypothetical protein